MQMLPKAMLAALLAGGLATPAFAQTPSAGGATTAPATHDSRTTAGTPSERNAVLTDQGEVRASKLVGTSVYNDHDEKLGTVDDVILGKSNAVDKVILSVGGFLGVGNKLVSVPYSDLKLGDTKHASSDNKVVMPGATKDTLKSMPDFHYTTRS
jgi:sporulation protein YlmC with PRC-barrel domain